MSPEFANRRQIIRLYLGLFERLPDEAGLDFWESRLKAGMSRAMLLVSPTESPEFVRGTDSMGTVTTIYSGRHRA